MGPLRPVAGHLGGGDTCPRAKALWQLVVPAGASTRCALPLLAPPPRRPCPPRPVPPRQAFFTEQLGMPLTMTPNFDDYSCEVGRPPPAWPASAREIAGGFAACQRAACRPVPRLPWQGQTTAVTTTTTPVPPIALASQMVFGKRPPSPDEDPVASQPCLAACATAQAAAPRCHKLD